MLALGMGCNGTYPAIHEDFPRIKAEYLMDLNGAARFKNGVFNVRRLCFFLSAC